MSSQASMRRNTQRNGHPNGQELSQNSQRSTQRSHHPSTLDIPSDLIKRLANDCVYYLLIADQKKTPIKKADIVKNVMSDTPKAFSLVYEKACKILERVYGIKVVELTTKPGYILVSSLALEEETDLELRSDFECAKQGLLATILTVIFMNENSLEEAAMWQMLGKLGVKPDVEHPVFGNVKKLLTTELVRQLYLEYKPKPSTEPPKYEFRWGPRAIEETNKKDLLQLTCAIYGNGLILEDWSSQFKDIQAAETEILESQNQE